MNYSDGTIEIGAVKEWPEDFEILGFENIYYNCKTGYPVNEADELSDTVIEPLGVYRPVLEDRKVGKVPMHMVNDGFPLALKAVAEIMGWARDVKGYKLHDWRNLPEADLAFPSAEYRHANENSIQKAQGLSALERVDHESGKLHIAHKVFNALAELELVLSGKIK